MHGWVGLDRMGWDGNGPVGGWRGGLKGINGAGRDVSGGEGERERG